MFSGRIPDRCRQRGRALSEHDAAELFVLKTAAELTADSNFEPAERHVIG